MASAGAHTPYLLVTKVALRLKAQRSHIQEAQVQEAKPDLELPAPSPPCPQPPASCQVIGLSTSFSELGFRSAGT